MLTIGEVAQRTGLAASALRYYERVGLIPVADRRGGKRVYDEDILGRLALIGAAKAAGFTLAEIDGFLAGFAEPAPPGPRWRRLAKHKRSELAQRIAEIERMQRVLDEITRCECPDLEACFRALGA